MQAYENVGNSLSGTSETMVPRVIQAPVPLLRPVAERGVQPTVADHCQQHVAPPDRFTQLPTEIESERDALHVEEDCSFDVVLEVTLAV